MNQEMFYTSAPKGLKPGTSGFCTVAATEGMSPALIGRLELLSGHQPLATGVGDQPAKDPVRFAHWRVPTAGRTRSVLSRSAVTGSDYTRRPNKLAYHLVLDPTLQPEAGPAWTMTQPGVMLDRWSGPPHSLKPRALTLPASATDLSCPQWKAVTGDAGWAGVLSEAFLLDPAKAAYLICTPEIDLLPLLDEAARLLPPRVRWQVTFSTYFCELFAGLSCAWRCVMAGTNAAKEAARGNLVIDLTAPLSQAPDTPGAAAAREARRVPVPPPDPSDGYT
jgi:hypothetical protein